MVSLDTLGDDSVTFIRDVLRQNLTDKQTPKRSGSAWIFKSRLATKEVDLPYVIITEDRETGSTLTIDPANPKMGIPTIRLAIHVWSHKINYRDEISDEIVKILKSTTSANSSGVTIRQNRFVFKRFEKYEEDAQIPGFPEITRSKRVMIEFKYIGG